MGLEPRTPMGVDRRHAERSISVLGLDKMQGSGRHFVPESLTTHNDQQLFL